VMRKYCRACGAPLISLEEESTPEPVEEIEDVPVEETPSFSDDESFVRPSDVASKQAEIEPVAPEFDDVIEEPPALEEMGPAPEESEVPESEVMDHERGKEVVADILERVRIAETRARGEESTEPAGTGIEPPPAEPMEVEEPLPYEEPAAELEVEEPVMEEPVAEMPAPLEPEPITVVEPPKVVSAPSSIEDIAVADDKVRTLESDINAYNIELGTLQSEFDTLRTHLDEEVDRYQTVAEVKRIRVESVERELDLAKKEYGDASKEHKNVENRRKKELSNAEKRIQEVEKRLKKAEESKDKRIEELEKERRKREEEVAKG